MDPITLALLAGGAYLTRKFGKKFAGGSPPPPPPPVASGYGGNGPDYGDLRNYADGGGNIHDGEVFVWIAFKPGMAGKAISRFGLRAFAADYFIRRHVLPDVRRGSMAETTADYFIRVLEAAESRYPNSEVYVIHVG